MAISEEYKVQQELAERGIMPPLPPVDTTMPPLDGEYAVQHHYTFASQVNLISHTYRYQFDEALKDCQANARAMRNDPVLLGALRSRQIPVASLDWHLEAQNESDPKQLEMVSNIEDIIKKNFPDFQGFKMWLLEAIWFGRSACQQTFKWDYGTGHKRLLVKDWRPVLGDKMVFKWSGEVGVLIYPNMKISSEPTERGMAHFLTPQERQCWVVHHFEREDVDFYNSEQQGAVMGVGVRGRLYWFWWLKAKVLSQLTDYLQRVAQGWTIYYYEQGNPTSMNEVALAAAKHIGGQAILFPRKLDNSGPGIQRLEPSQAGAELFKSLVTSYFDDVMEQYIKGQTLTSGTGSTGLGSGVAAAHQATQEMIVTYDAIALQETLSRDLLIPLTRWNHGVGMPVAKFVFDVEKPNVEEYMDGMKTFFEMGGQIDADDARSVLGIPRPEPGHEILAQMAPEQPATVGTPQGVPVQSQGQPADAGQPVPVDGQQGQPGTQQVPMSSVPPGAAMVQRARAKRFKEAMVQLARRKRERLMRQNGGEVSRNGTGK